MISIGNIHYTIDHLEILKDISVEFTRGKIHMLLGPNGAGKSTLIKILSGELNPSSGVCLFRDQHLHTLSEKELSKTRAVMSQHIELSFSLTVFEVILMGRYPHFENKPSMLDLDICNHLIQLLHLDAYRERDYLSLSGGEKQRVHLARVLAQLSTGVHQYEGLLLLDEPLAHLDVYYSLEMLQLLSNICRYQPVCIIGVIHDLQLAVKFANSVYFMSKGKIIASGSPLETIKPENIRECFQVSSSIHMINDHPIIVFEN